MSRLKKFALVAALALAAAACQDPVDKAAKARIFSPEDPPKVVASAAEKLPPEDVADDPRVARRVLGMDAAEVTERLGPHRLRSTLTYEWFGPEDTPPVRLTETRTFRAGPGGVSGDFHGVLENSRDQGLEVLRVRGQVYARNRYGPFRQRLRDRGMAERTRAELTGALSDVDALFLGRLKLTPQGTASYEGRTAWRYAVSLATEMPGSGRGDTDAPPPLLPPKGKGGQDETTRRRAHFFAHRTPRALSGEVWVDASTSVVLKARLDGRLGVPASETSGDAELHLALETALQEIGVDPRLEPPKDFLPDADKPQGIADALDRFGIPRGEAAAEAGASEKEPEDEDAP